MHALLLTFCAALTTLLLTRGQDVRGPQVKIGAGSLFGQHQRSAQGREYSAFRGIPYAQPPVGDLRFRPPRPHHGWTAVRNATEHGPMCIQFDMMANYSRRGEGEDCLYLNVYTPQTAFEQPSSAIGLPVMVWIHGGGFYSSSGDDELFGVDYLMDEDVVVVTLNYRLSIFGFLSTGDAAAPGNYGLLDQVMALRWVRDNIAEFGGNPQLVTVFGQSAGGASVSLHVVSPLSRGLFQRAITQSGAAAAPWALALRPQIDLTRQYAQQLQCPTENSRDIVECLRHADLEDIMEVQQGIGFFDLRGPVTHFRPTVDREAKTPFLPEHPNTLLENGRFHRVPWMIGFTQNEGIAGLKMNMASHGYLQRVAMEEEESWVSNEMLLDNEFESESGKLLEMGRKLKNFYQNEGGALSPDNFKPVTLLLGDWIINLCAEAESTLASRYVPVYRYVLDHTGPGRLRYEELAGPSQLPDLGVTHGDDLWYLFRSRRQTLPDRTSPAYDMVRLFVSLWTSFAKLGYPTSDVLGMPDWPVFNSEYQAYVRLNTEPSVSSGLFGKRMNFWRNLLGERWWSLQPMSLKKKTARTEL